MSMNHPVGVGDVSARRVKTIEVDGLVFRDLDHDGTLAPYEDWRRSPGERADDLLSRMTLPEKIGLMLHGSLAADGDGTMAVLGVGERYDATAAQDLIIRRHVTSAITRLAPAPELLAEQNNSLQDIAASGRLGIPLTVSSDPRHHETAVIGAGVAPSGFTVWPDALGLGAAGSAELVRQFGDCVRIEYRAAGIHMSLAPQADIASSQRWPRFAGTFGEDPRVVRELAGAYVEGAQGGRTGLHAESVACIVKHWVGYGASRDGFDGHNFYGRFSAFPTGAFDDHVDAFSEAFAVGVAGVMPTYNILEGVSIDGDDLEPVGAGFSAQLINTLLRGTHGFDGLVLSDWKITSDCDVSCRTGAPPQQPEQIAMCWGVEELSRVQRYAKAINAGVDQLGGEDDPQPLLDALSEGLISQARVDEAARRVLVQKFQLGLFENPFVDTGHTASVFGTRSYDRAAATAQRKACVVVSADRPALIKHDDVVFVDAPMADALARLGVQTTDDVTFANRAVVLTSTPHQDLHPGFFFARMQHEGDTDFKDDDPEWQRINGVIREVPTIVVITMDRPAVITPLIDRAAGIVVDPGTTVAAIADVLLGRSPVHGTLPFTLFETLHDVVAAPCDRPTDGPRPLMSRGTNVNQTRSD